jgi:uncharacterized protein with GYD domain
VKNVKDTVQRIRQYRADVERQGGKVSSIYWTQGQYDMITTLEVPDEQTMMATLLAACGLGNIRTETFRAFNETEMEAIIQKM